MEEVKKAKLFRIFFWVGFAVAIAATLLEVARGRNANYIVYSDATKLFWEGINPYTMDFVEQHGRYFLYLPDFCCLFAPIAFLPWWLGPFVYNLGNYTLFYFSIKTLPEKFNNVKPWIFIFLLPIVLQSVFCYQYNLVVCYIFLFAFTLLEKGKGFWAVLLILISTFTKVYGGIQLGMLFLYPNKWKNFGYAIIIGIILFLLPMVNPNFDNPLATYGYMMDMNSTHQSAVDYIGILYARGLKSFLLPNFRIVQLAVLGILCCIFFIKYRQWCSITFRTKCLAIMMGYVILFSDSPETHTYIIALAGYSLVFFTRKNKNKIDWILFWLLVINFDILPTDLLCPPKIHEFIHQTFWLDVYTFTICWFLILRWAIMEDSDNTAKPIVK